MKITLATVTYNAGNTIERTLKSVEEQTYDEIEHLIIDGVSKDDTVEKAFEYKKRNPKRDIVIVSEKDHGLYDAMNKAIRLATGDFICFLNAGDKLHSKTTIEELVASIPSGITPAVVYGNTDIVDDEGHFLHHRHHTPPEHLNSGSFRKGMLVCHQAFYANTSIVPEYDLKYKYSADFDWCVNVMKEGERQGLPFINTNLVLADYLSEGMTTRHHKESLAERFRIMRKHYGLIPTLWNHALFAVKNILHK